MLCKHVGGVGGLKEMLILLIWLGGGLEAKCSYCLCKGSNSFLRESCFLVCEISLNSSVKGHV